MQLRRPNTWPHLYLVATSWVTHTGSSSRKMGTWGQEYMTLVSQELKISREEETNRKVTT